MSNHLPSYNGIRKSLSDQLQSPEIDLTFAADLVLSTSDTLRVLRNDNTWNQTFKYIASINNIEAQEPRQRKRARRMDDNYVVQIVVLEIGSLSVVVNHGRSPFTSPL